MLRHIGHMPQGENMVPLTGSPTEKPADSLALPTCVITPLNSLSKP